jgi:hypothetical protein
MGKTGYVIRRKAQGHKDVYLDQYVPGGYNRFNEDIFHAMFWDDPIDLNDLPLSIRNDSTLQVIKVSMMAEIV